MAKDFLRLAGLLALCLHGGSALCIEPGADSGQADPRYAVATTTQRSGRIAVPVTINGAGPYRFLLDTGANRSTVTARLAAQLDLPMRAKPIVVQGVNGRVEARVASIASIRLGPVDVGARELPMLDGEVFEGLDGSLGADLLAGLALTADFVHDTVTIGKARLPQDLAHSGVIKAHRVSGWLVQAEGRARASGFRMVLDTGAARTLGNEALYRALTGRPLAESSALRVAVNDATETRGQGLAVSVSPIVLGNLVIENTTVAFGDYPVFARWGLERKPALLLGMDVLGTLREVTIDYASEEIIVQPRLR